MNLEELADLDVESLTEADLQRIAQVMANELGLEQASLFAFAANARLNCNAEGFSYFYRLVFEQELPRHAQVWVKNIFKDYENGKGSVIQAFRGSTKTTTVTIGLAAFLLGHRPTESGLLIQVGDDIATDNAFAVADLIANNPGWKLVFPQVVPDEKRGWGASGYWLRDASVEDGDWSKMIAGRKDPSFVGLGYKSRAIIGKHPTLFLFVDDIHDENNTLSSREREKVIKIVTGTIFPTLTPQTMRVFIGTPWTEDDILAYVEGTGEYEVTKTPILDDEGQPIWPEVFNEVEIKRARRLSGEVEYARMYLLDLQAAKVYGLKFHSYPHDLIDPYRWEGGAGCDYASIIDSYMRSTGEVKDRNFFALAYAFVLPNRQALVIADGVVEKCTQGEAEGHIKAAQSIYGTQGVWRGTVVEGDGKGEEFISVIQRNPGLRILPMKTGGRGKKQRLEREMGPYLEQGRILISDADTPFLDHLRKALTDYPNWHLDTLDAVYWVYRLFIDIVGQGVAMDKIPVLPGMQAQKARNPFLAFGSG